MLFLMLFSVLAVGFFAASTMNGQIARNEQNLERSRLAAEGGMSYIRYQLGAMTLPSGTNSSNLLTNVATQLGNAMNGTVNMGTYNVQVSNGAICIPAPGAYITSDASAQTGFQVTITQSTANPNNLVVTSVGTTPAISLTTRTIQLQYQHATGNTAILNYGIAAQGPIVASGNTVVNGASASAQGSMMSATASATPLTMSGNVSVSGDFADTNAAGTLSLSGNVSIGGYTPSQPQFAQHVHKGIAAPVFPTVDTSIYLPYAVNTYSGGSGNQTIVNALIPANKNPSFSGNTTIQGVLYIRTPNKVSFSGNVTIQGAIVVENNPQGSSNTLTFSGNVTASTMDTLPANATFPAGERALVGSFLLAPSFAVSLSGNFGTIGGSLVADSFTFSGNAGGQINGSVIALKDVPFSLSGNSPFVFGNPVTSSPAGLVFPGGFSAIPGTYIELQ